jgi:glycosyltransferase involved in cell wall biosynthesis
MERLLADIVRLTARDGFENHVLVLQYAGRFSEGLEASATLHHPGPQSRWSMLWPQALTRLISRIAPDVVHTHSGVWYKTTLAARRAGVPWLIHTEHGWRTQEGWLSRLIERRAAARTDVVVAVSDALADRLRNRIVPADRLVVIRNGVDTDAFAPVPDDGSLRRELRLPHDTPIIGSIGRLELVKGYDTLIEAVARLRQQSSEGPPPVLVVAGDGSERARLEQLAASLGVADAVHLLGWRDNIAALHGAFELFSIASHSEGTSVSLLEAMSAGLCPVVTDVGGNAAVLGPDLGHRLVPSQDAAAMADALHEALRDRARRRRDGARGRERVLAEFSLHHMVTRYTALYERIKTTRLEGAACE